MRRRLTAAALGLWVCVCVVARPTLARPAHAAPRAEPAASASDAGEPADLSLWMVSLWGLVAYGNGIGVGGRAVLPIMSILERSDLRERLVVDAGIDYVHFSYEQTVNNSGSVTVTDAKGNYGQLVAAGAWLFWLTPRLSVYPKVELGWALGSTSATQTIDGSPAGVTDNIDAGSPGFLIQGAAGAIYQLGFVHLRAELGTREIRIGAGFAL